MSAPQKKKSLVDYSKVADRPHDPLAKGGAAKKPHQQPSAQMEAVMRIMTGKEERSIAEKLADSNRPTWEQYKKDNQDKLNLDSLDQKQMEEYRSQLDADREERMSGAKKKKKRRRRDDDSSDSSSYNSSEDRKRKHKKKHKKKRHKKKKDKRRKKDDDDGDSDGSHYRLSNFFAQESES